MRIVIVGAGEVGFHIARRLSSENKDVVVIDRNPAALRRVAEQLDVQHVLGSGSSPLALEEAGIKGADILLAVTDSDETNLIACFFANALSPDISKVARIRNEEYTDYQDALARDILNISMVINPEVETVKTVLRMLRLPGVREISEFADGRISMLGVRVEKEHPLDGLKLTRLRQSFEGLRIVIAAIVRGGELIVPSGRDSVEADDIVYFVCETSEVERTLERFGLLRQPARDVLIVGGGNIGLRLARELETDGCRVKIVESDLGRCEILSSRLDRAIVLHGDGTDQELLREENAPAMDAVIAFTGDDETNVLTCLLAKSMGARQTIARVNKFPYVPLIQAIGVENVVSTRLSAINSILHAIRRGKVLSTVSLQGDEAEIMEAIALEKSGIVEKPIRDLDLPRGALILCMMREDHVVIPTGDSVIRPQDRILILSTRGNIPAVERALLVPLERV